MSEQQLTKAGSLETLSRTFQPAESVSCSSAKDTNHCTQVNSEQGREQCFEQIVNYLSLR